MTQLGPYSKVSWAFTDNQRPVLLTSDEDFVKAVVAQMSTMQFPHIKKHVPSPYGHMVWPEELDEDIDNLADWCASIDLPAPRDGVMFFSYQPRDTQRTIVVDAVPDFISKEAILDALVQHAEANVLEAVEQEIEPECNDHIMESLYSTVSHRNLKVVLKCDLDMLGSVLTRGLIVGGVSFRTRLVLCCEGDYPDGKALPRPAPRGPDPPPKIDVASQTDAVTSCERALQTQPPSPPAAQPAGSRGRRRRHSSPRSKQKQTTPPAARPKQCYRCQQWTTDAAHTSKTCTAPPRCRPCGIIAALFHAPPETPFCAREAKRAF
ncbi:uncharacterized protein LOC127751778 [Frankliniella occidentalis]|uniref:Uncharacterized protein LOC127751778 n=1 Tax=Frankliniella occidentalis TaxID=133901 RepID=A0A9C6XA10_FRAOC|nr:uncharacterized protein LOC127751778 [Frankliniella occidentalis]